MAEAPQRKTIVASGYKQVGSRATPEAIEKEIKKLPESAGPIDTRKRALHDLAHALAYVQEQHKVTVVEKCKGTNAVGLLVQLLTDIESAPPVTAAEDVIRVGRRVLGMGPMDARLYVLSCFVNLFLPWRRGPASQPAGWPDDVCDGDPLRYASNHAGLRIRPLLLRGRPLQPVQRRLVRAGERPAALCASYRCLGPLAKPL